MPALKHKVTTIAFSIGFALCAMLTVAPANAQQLWQITDGGGHQSHLLATQHIKHHQAKLPTEKVNNLLLQSDALVMEVLLGTDIYQGIYTMMATDPTFTIENMLPADSYKQLSSFMKSEYGLKLGYFKSIKPIFLYLIMVQTGVSTDNKPYLEEYYFNQAVLNDIPTIGLETFEEQLETLDTLNLQQQIALLEATIARYPDLEMGDKLISQYNKGKLKKLLKMQEELMPKPLFDAWVTARNAKLAERLLPLLQQQNLFVMIPAYQLEGKDGLLQLLQNKGLKVKPLR